MTRQIVSTENAPGAIGPYSQGIVAGGFLFTAMQIALDPQTGQLVGESSAEQARQALTNAQAIVAAAGLNLSDAVKVTIFIKDLNDFGAINEVYQTFFSEAPPARGVAEVTRLPMDAMVAVEMVVCAAE